MQCNWERTDNPVYNRLMSQFVENVVSYARGGNIVTLKEKYRRYKLFLEFISEKFVLGDIKNIQPKHIASFVRGLKRKGQSMSMILAYLSFIRWWHGQIRWRKYDMPGNSEIFILEGKLDDKKICEEFKNRYRRKKGH